MTGIEPSFFENEKALLKDAKELIEDEKRDEKSVFNNFSVIVKQFDKVIRDVEKIIRISDGQQEYLHRIQSDLKKEIEDRIRAEEKLKYYAAIDTLTGVYNRGMGLALLEAEIKSIRRNKDVFSMCYIDLDGLKHVNDNYGHPEGDELLVITCKLVKEVIRNNDILCRVGGDEFIILFPNMQKEDVDEAMRKITLNIVKENEKKLRPYDISFSYGIVQVECDDGKSIDEIIQMADADMYKFKKKYKKSCFC
ncbi:GGDEF domain-containing protein [Clostridium chromiireducens]|uniref:Diguanylate cyclase n=1 Tax=Clostridium chromiireducens TaxID=225345 RepID=A0A1V4IZA5_9CLOT|nr:GGDEF domain-containing protein [Clostridium chromiireducens]MVX64765.1 diguanylate cyclase [Clostridium chromiireducens]OPJ64737.1 putative diguanylate cyclase YdaM [Clostridium chromiireducens]RII35960.1 GGDEF domain-containing protein [Clostridium chromiireducens]